MRFLELYNLARLLGVLLVLLVFAVASWFGVDLQRAQYAIPGVPFALLGVLLAIYFKRRNRTPETETYEVEGYQAGPPIAVKTSVLVTKVGASVRALAKIKRWQVLLVPAAIGLFVLVFDVGPRAWNWLTEDLGARLRRECETVVRESYPEFGADDRRRESYVRQCIGARARLMR
jgi:hypothetical protein